MRIFLMITVSLFFFSFCISAQETITQIEGFLEIYLNGDGTSLYIGDSAGQTVTESNNSRNTFVGNLSGAANTNGGSNSFFGFSAGGANTAGVSNSFFGMLSGLRNTTGSNNSFFGRFVGPFNTTGRDNTFFGSGSGNGNTTGSKNCFFGLSAGSNITTQDKIIALGPNSGPPSSGANNDERLYIDVEESTNPLIYAEFDNDLVRINGTLQTGAQNYFAGSDDGLIRSPRGNGSDLFLIANDGVIMEIGDVASQVGTFEIWNGGLSNLPGIDNSIFKVDEAGNVSADGAINGMSDVNSKESFTPINSSSVLEKITNLLITEWQYKSSSDRHIGPMAQDFYAAFGLGQGETTIATVDADGVALAAIQALAQENQRLEKKSQKQEAQISKMNDRLKRLEKLVSSK